MINFINEKIFIYEDIRMIEDIRHLCSRTIKVVKNDLQRSISP